MPNSFESFQARTRIDLSFILAGLLLLLGIGLLVYEHDREEGNNEWVLHTDQVIDQLKTIEALLVDAETGVRGYVATGDSVFLQPYRQALPNLSRDLKRLPELVADNPPQQRRAMQLSRLAQAKVAAVTQLARPQPKPTTRSLLAEGKRRMDAVRAQVARMVRVERSLLSQRQQRLQTAYQTIRWLTGVVMGLALLAFWQAYGLIRGEYTQRRQAQQQARYNAELLRHVIDHVPSGIVLYKARRDQQGQVVDFVPTLSNPVSEWLMGQENTLLLLAQDTANQTNGGFTDLVEVVETGEPIRRLIHLDTNGIRGWFDVQYVKQDDGILFTYLDVTGLKEAELAQQQQARALEVVNRELQRSNASLQSFAYVASHDLQAPLRKIISFGNLLQQQYSDQLAADALDYIERMQSAAGRMSVLIRDLLAYARLSGGATSVSPVSLPALVEQVLDDLEEARQRSGAQIVVGQLPILPGDATQLRQLLQNLIGNAIKFSAQPPGGGEPRVRVSSELKSGAELPTRVDTPAAQQYWEISVADNGIGFDMVHLDRLFEVFQRLNPRQQYAGTGIGLAICKQVVENHGGQITARSQLGQGATFLVYLPAAQPAGAA